MASDNQQRTIFFCSHGTPVVRTAEGWIHISSDGMLEMFTQPCTSHIHGVELPFEFKLMTRDNRVPEPVA